MGIVLAGCAPDDLVENPTASPRSPRDTATVESCSGEFRWSAGSVPHPYSYYWVLTVMDQRADFSFHYGGPDTPAIKHTDIEVNDEMPAAYCTAVAQMGEGSLPAPGSRIATWDFDFGSGESGDSDEYGEAKRLAIQIIGKDRFAETVQAQQEYADSHR